MPLEPESDLHWTAFLYVSGELDPDESSGFERLLAEDQPARDAVALAVELLQALSAVEPARKSASGRWANRHVLAWAGSLAAAACLAALMLPNLRTAVPIGAVGTTDASSVALAWSGLRVGADQDWTAFVDGTQAAESPAPDQFAELDDPDGREAPASRPLPSWLLSAASVPAGETPHEEN